MEPQHPASTSARPERASARILDNTSVFDCTVVRDLGDVLAQQANAKLWQGKHGIDGLAPDRKCVFALINAARPAEFEEVGCEEFVHAVHVEAGVLTPEFLFETLEKLAVSVARFHDYGDLLE
jgi:hypothetical protein